MFINVYICLKLIYSKYLIKVPSQCIPLIFEILIGKLNQQKLAHTKTTP